MRKGLLSLLGIAVFTVIVLTPATSFAATSTTTATSHTPHIFSSRDVSQSHTSTLKSAHVFAASNSGNSSSSSVYSASNLTYQGGPVMAGTVNVYTIFWQPTGSVSTNYKSLINRYFGDVGSSPLYQTLKQYTDASGQYSSGSQLAGTWVDTGSYPVTSGLPTNTILDSDIQNEVTHAQSVNSWSASNNNVFFVFLEKNAGLCDSSNLNTASCTPNVTSVAQANMFCAYHSYFGTNTIYAAMPYAASPNFRGGCTPGASPNADDADLTLNVTSHEQMEAASDPLLNAWYNSAQLENGDLCAWTFGPGNANGADVVWNNHGYIVQQEWDNSISSCTLTNNHVTKYYDIVNRNGNLSIDVLNGGKNAGAQAIQWPYHGALDQQWTLVPDGPYFQILNRNSGLVLDVFHSGTTAGVNVIQWTNNQGLGQQWVLVPDGNYDQIVNVNSGLVLDVSGGGTNAGAHIVQWTNHNGTSQQWGFTAVAPYYKIQNVNSGLAMDIFHSGTNTGAPLVQWSYSGSYNQQWNLVPYGTSNGVQIYQIQNVNSGLVLDVFHSGKTAGVPVVQWTNNHSATQQWFIVKYNNHFQIVNRNSGLVLDVFHSGKTAGVPIVQWTNNHSATQQWDLIPTSV